MPRGSIAISILSSVILLSVFAACEGENCRPHAQTYCSEGISYWLNSCGDVEEVAERCFIGCAADHLGCKPGDCLDAAACEDDNPCTDDACVDNFCRRTDNQLACDDGDRCTLNDTCAAGICVGTPDDCDDGSACTADACDSVEGCLNTYICHDLASCLGGTCVCDAGYRGDGTACADIDECAENLHACDPNASCANTPGTYTCTCEPPYEGDGFFCSLCGNGECDEGETLLSCPVDCDLDIVIVVPSSLLTGISTALATYRADLRDAGYGSRVLEWTSGSASDLRSLLADARTDYAIEGALLLGTLPSAWYECECWQDYGTPMHEEYPTDIYLMDLDANWYDSDNDGIYDGHSALHADIFVSRVVGGASSINAYLAKVHDYRNHGSFLPQQAFIFMDDDWADFHGTYGLDGIYSSIDLLYNTSSTTRANYLARMEGAGAEFVYQWIHAYPSALYIYHYGSEQIVDLDDIISGDHRASFLNLFDCSAARYTEYGGCLAQTYLLGTSYGLASIGSTKTGGIYMPEVFHARLAAGATWGEAYRQWYNATGVTDDEWHLGIVIAGDPLLTIQGTTRGMMSAAPSRTWTEAERERLSRIMLEHARDHSPETFEEYRRRRPQLFP